MDLLIGFYHVAEVLIKGARSSTLLVIYSPIPARGCPPISMRSHAWDVTGHDKGRVGPTCQCHPGFVSFGVRGTLEGG